MWQVLQTPVGARRGQRSTTCTRSQEVSIASPSLQQSRASMAPEKGEPGPKLLCACKKENAMGFSPSFLSPSPVHETRQSETPRSTQMLCTPAQTQGPAPPVQSRTPTLTTHRLPRQPSSPEPRAKWLFSAPGTRLFDQNVPETKSALNMTGLRLSFLWKAPAGDIRHRCPELQQQRHAAE